MIVVVVTVEEHDARRKYIFEAVNGFISRILKSIADWINIIKWNVIKNVILRNIKYNRKLKK